MSRNQQSFLEELKSCTYEYCIVTVRNDSEYSRGTWTIAKAYAICKAYSSFLLPSLIGQILQ